MIKLVLFDLWGTLIVDDPAVARQRARRRVDDVAAEVASLGMPYTHDDVRAAFAAADAEHGRVHADGRDFTAEGRTVLYLRHLDPAIAERLDDEGWRRMHRAVLTPALTHSPSLMPGALEALLDVKALGLPIGLVSNAGATPGFVLREILERHGLLAWFDETVFSDEVELAKPAAAIFEHALDAFGVAPGDAAFVGDQPVLDVLGPVAAGLWSIQLGELSHDGIEPHARISSLAGLVPAMRSLGLV